MIQGIVFSSFLNWAGGWGKDKHYVLCNHYSVAWFNRGNSSQKNLWFSARWDSWWRL